MANCRKCNGQISLRDNDWVCDVCDKILEKRCYDCKFNYKKINGDTNVKKN